MNAIGIKAHGLPEVRKHCTCRGALHCTALSSVAGQPTSSNLMIVAAYLPVRGKTTKGGARLPVGFVMHRSGSFLVLHQALPVSLVYLSLCPSAHLPSLPSSVASSMPPSVPPSLPSLTHSHTRHSREFDGLGADLVLCAPTPEPARCTDPQANSRPRRNLDQGRRVRD